MSPQNLFHHDFAIEVPIAVAVFVLVTGTMLFAVAWFRRRPGREPSRTHSHPALETVYGVVVAAVAIFLVVNSITTNGDRLSSKPAVRISVTGFQWCWRFQYVAPSVGPTVTGRCVGGDVPTAVVPVGQVVRFDVTSDDVIHAFWIPYLKYKTYAYPGHVNTFEARFAKPGTYVGRCAEFCGLYHSDMEFRIQAVPGAQYGQWMTRQPGGGQPGAPPS
jgi:cytochrome c oxidase subunit 2